jgi:hypothetical protein
MTTVSQNSLTTGDYPVTSGGYYNSPYDSWYYPSPYSVPYWNPPVYIQPTYIPVPVAQPVIGTIVFAPDTELKEEVKGLKDEIRKLRKELNASRKADIRKRPME